MPAEQEAERLFELIKGGRPVDPAKIIEFKADNGQVIAEGIKETLQGANGQATEVTVGASAGAAGAGATTGAGLLAVDVGVAGAAIAPVLGLLAGVALYKLAPEFWTNVSDQLVNAGKTIGGKVIGFFGPNSETGFDKETIEIFAEAFKAEDLFNKTVNPNINPTEPVIVKSDYSTQSLTLSAFPNFIYNNYYVFRSSRQSVYIPKYYLKGTTTPFSPSFSISAVSTDNYCRSMHLWYSETSSGEIAVDVYDGRGELYSTSYLSFQKRDITYKNQTKTIYVAKETYDLAKASYPTFYSEWVNKLGITKFVNPSLIQWLEFYGDFSYVFGEVIDFMQPNATPPTTGDITIDYPEYQPWYIPDAKPAVYPVPVPDHGIEQGPAQDGEQVPIPTFIPWILPTLPIPEPAPTPQPEPEPGPVPKPDPDPEPAPEPEPSPEPEPLPQPNPVTPEPVNPPSDNPTPEETPTPTPVPPIIVVPSIPTVQSSALFTVYNPTMAQLNQLGAFLWSNSVIDTIKKIWQNPMDGIISLKKVYAVPLTSGSSNIILGNIDTSVQSLVVSSQFTSIPCGVIKLGEKFFNSTDYSPYTTVHIYLPFIGIVELDVDEVMDAELYVNYSVDVYSGACLAEIAVKRTRDMPTGKILYQFSGDCSQTLPLTSSVALGLANTVASLGAAAIGVVSGGAALGAAATANLLGHTLTHEMMHVGRSGSLSSNPGIMGQRKPYAILGRRNSYDANGYNEYWGYPANKTVFLGNCTGFTKIKAINLQTLATQQEKTEIEELLRNGVIF